MPNCSKCAAAITFVKTVRGNSMPVDAEPVTGGNLEIKAGVAHYMKPEPGVRRYVSHFATCPEAKSFRKARP